MKNKIIKLVGVLILVVSACINFTSCDYGTYNIYPEENNGSGNGSDNRFSENDSSEMMAVFKTSKNIGRPIKLKIKISAEKTSSLGTLNYYTVSGGARAANVYCYDDFTIIDPPAVSFGGAGSPVEWESPVQPVDFKIKIESDIPPLDDLPIYFAEEYLGDLKGFSTTAEFTISGKSKFKFINYLGNSYEYTDYSEEEIHLEGNIRGESGETSGGSEIKKHSHRIKITGDLINAQSPKSVDIYLSEKNILEDFPLIIGESTIPLENVSLEFSFTPSVGFSGTASVSDTNSCCYQAGPEEGGSRMPTGTTYTSWSSSATASWDIYHLTEKAPILMVPASIILEEESTELPGIDTDTENNSPIV